MKNLDPKTLAAEYSDFEYTELELLGMPLLKHGACIPVIADIVQPSDFSRNDFQLVYNAILQLYAAGEPVTLPSIGEYLHSHDNDLDKVGYNLVMDLGLVAFTDVYAAKSAEIVKKRSLQRQMSKILEESQDALKRGADNALADIARNVLNFFDSQSAQITKMPPATRIADYFSGGENSPFRKACSDNQQYAQRKCGFSNLNALQTWTPGLYVIGAPPAAGKTTFCWQLAESFANNGERCVFVSGEMSKHEMLTKSIARCHFWECRRRNLPPITSTVIKTGKWQDEANAAVERAIDAGLDETEIPNMPEIKSADLLLEILDSDVFSKLDLQIVETNGANIDDILLRLRSLVADKPSIICLDYLQLFKLADETAKTTESDRLQTIMQKLKDFSCRYNALVIAISAFNRDSYATADTLKVFRGSSCVEYGADVAFTLSLNSATELDETGRKIPVDNLRELQKRQPRPIKLSCVKNRSGNIYDVFFEYFSAHDCFIPVDDPDRVDEGEKTISAQNAGNDTSDAEFFDI